MTTHLNKNSNSLGQLYPHHSGIPILIGISAILLGVGLFFPLMNVEQMVFWKNDYSVITGTLGLFRDKEYFLSAILFIFSVVFPIVKIISLGMVWQFKFEDHRRDLILQWLGILGKWSMLDVFVVAILIVAIKLGPMASVKPRVGIYIFSIAIILSMITTTWIERLIQKKGSIQS